MKRFALVILWLACVALMVMFGLAVGCVSPGPSYTPEEEAAYTDLMPAMEAMLLREPISEGARTDLLKRINEWEQSLYGRGARIVLITSRMVVLLQEHLYDD